MSVWHRARELAGLPDLPGTERGVHLRAKKEGWRSQSVSHGKGREYHMESLPVRARNVLLKTETTALVLSSPSLPSLPSPHKPLEVGDLKDWQKEAMLARLAVLHEVERRAKLVGNNTAIDDVVEIAKDGMLPDPIQTAIPKALAKSGSGVNLSVRTIKRWKSLAKKGPAFLAPKPMEFGGEPVWAANFLKRWQTATRQDITEILRDMAREGVYPRPSYAQARRYLKDHVGEVEKQKGRLSTLQLKTMLPFLRRDTSKLQPAEVFIGDGHSSYVLVAHPNTGKPFVPELTEILDVATRRHIGLSVHFSENTIAVSDALRMAIANGGVPKALQCDRGSGIKNDKFNNEVTGLAARLGFELYHPQARNPQAAGIIERVHKAILIPAARQFPGTYIGRRAKNPDLLRLVNKKIKEGKVELPTLADLLNVIEFLRVEYNARPHSSLPKIIDPITKTKRHQSPNEAWQAALDDGWKPVLLGEDLLSELRLEETRQTSRGEIDLHGMRYFSDALREFHRTKIRVRFDVRDGSKVWVYHLDGRFICEAKRDANLVPYLSDNYLDVAGQKRLKAQLGRVERKAEKLRDAGTALEATAEPLSALELEQSKKALQKMEAAVEEAVQLEEVQTIDGRPFFSGEFYLRDWGRWMLTDPPQATDVERLDFAEKMEKLNFRLLIGAEEMAS